MSQPNYTAFNPELDLLFERSVDVPPELVWNAWTQPAQVLKWFTPAPWKTVECEIDLRPGGLFYTVMQSPEGQNFPNLGCYLEVVPNHKLVWTSVLQPGFRPAPQSKPIPGHDCADLLFTAALTFEKHGSGTKYIAHLMHRDKNDCKKHADMGFHDGWGTALDQLVAMVNAM